MHLRWLIPMGAAAAAVAQVAHATQYMTVEQAQRVAFPQADEFRAAAPPDAAMSAALGAAAGWSPRIWQARAVDKPLGWLIVDQVIGKSEQITYALALDSAGTVISI